LAANVQFSVDKKGRYPAKAIFTEARQFQVRETACAVEVIFGQTEGDEPGASKWRSLWRRGCRFLIEGPNGLRQRGYRAECARDFAAA